MKAYKNIGFGPRKSKKGFTLIELLIVMVILAILAGVVVMAVGGVFGTSRETAYNTTQGELKNAVAQYASEHMGALPNISAFATDVVDENGNVVCNASASHCYAINVPALLVESGGILAKAPDSCSSTNGGDCDGNYTWVMDNWGNVYSACDGSGCSECTTATNSSDYTNGYCDPVYP